jgi:hypothetical protein
MMGFPSEERKMNVQIYNANEELVTVSWFQLLQWKHSVHLEMQGLKNSRGSVCAHVKRKLGFKKSTRRSVIYGMLCYYVDDLKAQMEEQS